MFCVCWGGIYHPLGTRGSGIAALVGSIFFNQEKNKRSLSNIDVYRIPLTTRKVVSDVISNHQVSAKCVI